MDFNQFLEQEKERVLKLYTVNHKPGFSTKQELSDWYLSQIQKQNYNCYYCETSIFDIRSLIEVNVLKARKIRYGFRGLVLEIDKKENSLGYQKENCVLACYYCNNDKSYTMDSNLYKKYFGISRFNFFQALINQMRKEK
ncbi:hypothetical protein EZ428_11890 [Pedobacter frigiditerrae]|uniref:HNH endonuclease n=1 Tax=Pedobacter frigiditerrae TaxID=2530452 RepID=A0A4R0N269_9SPHI|nr:hypothetical protein EZ428_11890 [Pedobacter frigiditerrae]